MALLRTWCLRVFPWVCTLLFLGYFWHHISRLPEGSAGGLSWVVSSKGQGLDFSLLLSGDLAQSHRHEGLVVLILVTSHPAHSKHRTAIRKSWAIPDKMAAYHFQVVFLIGRTTEPELEWRIHKEQVAHGDILMGNYIDTYRNLTLKVIHGLKWAADKCQPQYILKTDDDCFVNTGRLAILLSQSHHLKGLYVGSAFSKDKRSVIRDPASKWYVSHQDYKPDVYPPYASGIGYILSLDAARAVLRMSQTTSPIPMEDAYIGILAGKAKINLLSSSRFTKFNIKWSLCNYRYLMVIHWVSPQEQEGVLERVHQAETACVANKEVNDWK
ncbi:hypothetical protein GDO86_017969 [Hymenochirus boettgeri]|uniref:Hexosyltransferase n=1 Tax=Hymenochirus boettgeri TaxID=247094 RepID=A0A8T2IKH8_9PIPI|nr:hypothetical protein GDO86_017969 [Hymenochirus boettgeri]